MNDLHAGIQVAFSIWGSADSPTQPMALPMVKRVLFPHQLR